MDPSQLLGKGGGSLPRQLSPEQREALMALDDVSRSAAIEVIVLIMQCSPTPEETSALEAVPADKRSQGRGGFGPVRQCARAN